MLNLIAAIVSLIVVIATSLCFGLYVFRVRAIAFELQEFLWGVIACYFIQTILFSVLINFAAMLGAFSSSVVQQLIYWIFGALCFYLCFLVLNKVAFKGRLSEGRISRVCFAAILIKIAADILSAAWSNVNVAWRLWDGSLEEFLATSINNPAIDVGALTSLYQSYGPLQYVHLAVMAVVMALASYLLLLQMAEGKSPLMQAGFVAVFTFFYNFTLVLPVPSVLTLAALAFIGIQLRAISQILEEVDGYERQLEEQRASTTNEE